MAISNHGIEIDEIKHHSDENISKVIITEVIEYRGDDSHLKKFFDSFRRAEGSQIQDSNMTDIEKAAINTANSPLSKSLKNRHMQMIAIGGSIGTGLFVGSGKALAQGGPGGLIIGYFLVASIIYCTVQSLAELTVAFPVSGSFITYNTRFIDPSWGFAMAWNYALQWVVSLPLELVAASLTIDYWNSNINSVVWVAIFYILIVLINLFGVRGYGEAEFFFSIIKIIAIMGFCILSIILISGGIPGSDEGYIGGKYFHNPGSFPNGFKGVVSVFVTAAFSFAGTELSALAAAEAEDPTKSLPKAIKQVFWRIVVFYLLSTILICFLVPYNDPQLFNGSSTSASPFVIAIQHGGIKVLPSIMNVVIMTAVLSVANASVFASSRPLAALAQAGQGPKFLAYIDRKGRPIMALLCVFVFGLLCFVSASPQQENVFNWLLALSGLSSIFTWMSICICHLRFRRAMRLQGRSLEELAFVSQTGTLGSYYSIIFNIVILIAQFWIALYPIGSAPDVSTFFQIYLAAPVVGVFYIGHKIWTKNWIICIKAQDLDIDTGRRDADLELEKEERMRDKEMLASSPFYIRVWNFWC